MVLGDAVNVDTKLTEHQAANPKFQGNFKLQGPIPNLAQGVFEVWNLVLPWSLVLGIWSLFPLHFEALAQI